MTAYEQAKEDAKDIPRPTTQEFIEHAKNNFVQLGLLFGNGFVLHAVEIAEELLDARNRCGNCDMLYCECGE
jgi:hypothetical protein